MLWILLQNKVDLDLNSVLVLAYYYNVYRSLVFQAAWSIEKTRHYHFSLWCDLYAVFYFEGSLNNMFKYLELLFTSMVIQGKSCYLKSVKKAPLKYLHNYTAFCKVQAWMLAVLGITYILNKNVAKVLIDI